MRVDYQIKMYSEVSRTDPCFRFRQTDSATALVPNENFCRHNGDLGIKSPVRDVFRPLSPMTFISSLYGGGNYDRPTGWVIDTNKSVFAYMRRDELSRYRQDPSAENGYPILNALDKLSRNKIVLQPASPHISDGLIPVSELMLEADE